MAAATGSIAGTTVEATQEGYEFSHHWPSGDGGSVWYRWTAPASGTYLLDTLGAGMDSVLAVYHPGGTNGLTRVASDDDAWWAERGSRLRFEAESGRSYYVVVAGKYETTPGGAFTLRWRPLDSPENDQWIWARELTGAGSVVSGTTVGATPGMPGERESKHDLHGGHSVWYLYRATATGTVTASVTSAYRTILTAYEGSTPGTDVFPAASDVDPAATRTTRVRFEVEAGKQYRIGVDGWDGATGPFDLTWSFDAAPLDPANDNFASAQELTETSGTLTGTTFGATAESCEPRKRLEGSHAVWYRLDAAFTGTLTVDTAGSRFDTVVAVMEQRGGCWSSSGWGDDDGNGDQLTDRLSLAAIDGFTYWIAVGGQSTDTGAYTLAWRLSPASPPPNDVFASASVLSGQAGSLVASNSGAGKEAGEPAHAGEPGGRSIWYRWTAPQSGRAVFRVTESGYLRVNPALAVHRGTTVSGLTEIASSKDWAERTARVVFDVVAGETYALAIDTVAGNEGPVTPHLTMTWNSGTPPANDAFANAQLLEGSHGSVPGTNKGALGEPGEPPHSGTSPAAASVWYRWVAPVSGTASFGASIAGGSRPIFAVYAGSTVGGLTAVGRTPGRTTLRSYVVFETVRGQTYYFAVDETDERGADFTVEWRSTSVNDDFDDAIELQGASGSADGMSDYSSAEPGEPVSGGASIWYRWTAPASGTVKFETCRSGWNTYLNVFVGTSVAGLSRVASSNDVECNQRSRLWFTAVAGQEYRISVDSPNGNSFFAALDWAYETPPPGSAGGWDAWASPYGVSRDDGLYKLSNAGATKEAGETNHAGNSGGHSVWLGFEAVEPGETTLDLAGSGFDTLLAVYRKGQNDTISSMPLVVANDDSGGPTSRVTFRTEANTTYRIAVDGKNGEAGSFTLSQSWAPVPGNDGFAYAMDTYTSRSEFASLEAGEPSHGTASGRSVWFRYQAYESGPVTVDTHGSSFDTSMAVYTGTSPAAAVQVAQNDDWDGRRTSQATFDAVAGTTYKIAVAGSGGFVQFHATRGTVPVQPVNDFFDAARPLDGASGNLAQDHANSTREWREPGHAGGGAVGSLWYRWTAAFTGSVTFHSFASGGSPRLAAYTGTDVRSLTRIASASGNQYATYTRVEFAATAGTTYSIALAGGSALSWFLRDPAAAPPHVDVVTPSEGERLDSWENFMADVSDGDGIARVEVSLGETLLWTLASRPFAFTWDPQRFADGPAQLTVRAYDQAGNVTTVVRNVVLDTRGPSATITAGPPPETDAATASFTFASDEQDARFECRLDSAGFAPCVSPAEYGDLAPGPHSFGVRAISAAGRVGYGSTRDWTIAGSVAARPGNDNLASATPLAGDAGSIDATSVDATKEPDEPSRGGRAGGKSIWFSWIAPRTGAVAFDTFGSGFNDPLLAVYTGDTVGSLTLQHQNDEWDVGETGYQAKVLLGAVAGTTYRIAVDGDDRASGPTKLNWAYLPYPPPADSLPPQTDFLSGQVPAASATSGTATFGFTSYQVGSTFECRLDAGEWVGCRSQYTVNGLTSGTHAFEVRATDVAGNTDTTPARYQWTVAGDTTAPETTLTGGPSGTVSSTSATFTFTTDDPYAGFECSLDAGQWIQCASPRGYSSLAYGTHEFRVRAWDPAGNIDATPASRTWTIAAPDATAPETTITAGPSGTTTSTSASFSFSASEQATFECALDGAAYAPCTSPRAYSGLAGGSHTFTVRATDAVGNVDASPASRTWTISNDAFAVARLLPGTSGNVSGSNAGATKESGEPNHGGDRGGASVWFSWTAPAAGSVTIHTGGSSFDTLLGVYRGTSVSALTTVASNNNDGGLVTSRLSFTATAGTVYRIAVDGRRGRTGSYTLTWSQASAPPPPSSDTTPPDTTITAGPSGTVTATSASFSFSSTEAGSFACRLDGAPFAACTSPRSYTGLAVGTHTFEVRASDAAGNTGASPASRTWTISSSTTGSNDMFAAAQTLAGGSGTATGTTTSATKESGEPNHAGNAGGKSIWFAWTAPKSATVTFDTIGSPYDTLLAAYTGSAVNALTVRASNDDASGLQSRISFAATAGTVYRIAVDGYNGVSGSVTLNWSQP